MSEAKHTPGPWTASEPQENFGGDCFIYGADRISLARVSVMRRGVSDEERIATARLIAAAPDQNAALIEADSFMAEVIEYLRDHHDVVDGDYGEPAPNRAMQLSTWADEVAAKIERALKKAEAANVG